MAANKEPIFVGDIIGKATQVIGTSAPSATVDIFVADATESTRLDSLTVSTNDTTARDMVLQLYISGSGLYLGFVAITANAGWTTSVAPVNILGSGALAGHVKTDAAGNKYLNMPAGSKVSAQISMTNTASYQYNFIALGGKY